MFSIKDAVFGWQMRGCQFLRLHLWGTWLRCWFI